MSLIRWLFKCIRSRLELLNLGRSQSVCCEINLANGYWIIDEEFLTIPAEEENIEKEDETEEGELDPIVAQLRTIFFLPLPADVSARSGHLRNICLAFLY